MKLRAGIWLGGVALLAVGIALLAGLGRLQVHSDMLALLPEPQRDPVKAQAMERIAAMGQRRLTLLIGGVQDTDPQPAARAAAKALSGSPHFDGAVTNVSDWRGRESGEESEDIVFQHRFHLLAPDDRRALERLAGGGEAAPDGEGLDHFLQRAKRRLYGLSFGGGQFIQDPLGLSQAYLLSLASAATVPGLRIGSDGGLRAENADGVLYAAVFAESRADPYTLEAQEHQLSALDSAMAAAHEAVPGVEIMVSGTLRHAAAATRQARGEVSVIGFGSMTGILLLMLWAFSGVRPFLLSAMALAGGCALAVVATGLIFGSVHVLTIVFGASLMGVAIDYCFHFFAQRWQTPGRRAALRRILPAIALGLTTSCIAYSGMAVAPFPGLRQMAVFAVFGLVGAWFGVLLLLPAAAGPVPDRRAPLNLARAWLERGLPHVSARLGGARTGLAAGTAVVLLGVTGFILDPADDVRLLHSSPPHLVEEEQRVAEILGQRAPGRMIVVEGDSRQSVLEYESRVVAAIRETPEPPARVTAITDSYPTVAEQAASHGRLRETLYRPGGEVESLLLEVGYPRQRVEEHLRTFQATRGEPLALESWLASPYGAAFEPFWLGNVAERWVTLVQVHEIHDGQALDQLLDRFPGSDLIDRVAEMSGILGNYRQLITLLLAVAYALAWIVLSVVIDRRSALAIVLAPMLASIIVALVFALSGWPFSLFNVMALLLLLGMGADYGIFLRMAGAEASPAMAAVGLSAMTTMLSFGLLSLSQTPALHSFGLTLAIGLTLTFLLASALCGTADDTRSESPA